MNYLHTMIRVGDLEGALAFFALLGLSEIRRMENEKGRFTLVYLAAPDDVARAKEADAPMIELTYNWDQAKPYDLGTGFGHLAIGVPDVYKLCEDVTKAGGKVTRPAGPVKFGTTVIAFVEDPDGYKIELIQRKG